MSNNMYIELMEKNAVTEYRKTQLENLKIVRCRNMVRHGNIDDSEMASLRNKFESMAKQMKTA